MSKKNFIDGLESIFTDAADSTFQEDSPFFSYEAKSNVDPHTHILKQDLPGESSSLDEDDDYDEDENIVDQESEEKKDVAKPPRKPLTGLDLLIRNTTLESNNPNSVRANQRKVSLVFDKQLLSKLKLIAKKENTNFRLMISDMLTLFVDRYEKDKGPVSPKK